MERSSKAHARGRFAKNFYANTVEGGSGDAVFQGSSGVIMLRKQKGKKKWTDRFIYRKDIC